MKKHYKNIMKRNIVLLTVFLSMATLAVYAQPFTPTQAPQVAMQSQQIMQNGQNHDGTIYAPFDASAPSEQSEVEGNSGSRPRGGIKRGGNFNYGTEYGQSNESPIGEPWILAIFALAFAGVLALRKRKNHRTT